MVGESRVLRVEANTHVDKKKAGNTVPSLTCGSSKLGLSKEEANGNHSVRIGETGGSGATKGDTKM